MSKSKIDYTLVDEEEGWSSNSSQYHNLPPKSFWTRTIHFIIIAVVAIFFTFGGFVFGHRLGQSGQSKDDDVKVYKGTSFESHPRRFNGSFYKRSQYSGPPSIQMSNAWAHYTETGHKPNLGFSALIGILEEDALKATSYPLETAARIKDGRNEGYMASIEMFHQIHCLDMLRRFIYFDYYLEVDPEWATTRLVKQHADHCVDMLRDVLMCHGDTGLIVYHWVSGFQAPVPDFSTPHTCREPEDILKWTRDHEIILTEELSKKEGQIELPEVF